MTVTILAPPAVPKAQGGAYPYPMPVVAPWKRLGGPGAAR